MKDFLGSTHADFSKSYFSVILNRGHTFIALLYGFNQTCDKIFSVTDHKTVNVCTFFI